MTWPNEKNGMDNLKIMDNGKGLEPAHGVCQVMICCNGGATDLCSLKIIFWLMSNLLFESTCGQSKYHRELGKGTPF